MCGNIIVDLARIIHVTRLFEIRGVNRPAVL